ncbi:MAG: YbjN domain-containing protein [Pseudomonadota bacterium]
MTMLFIRLSALMAVAALAAPASAQDDSPAEVTLPDMAVSATSVDGVLAVVKAAGFKEAKSIPQLDDGDKRMIEVENEGLTSFILFKDCDEAVPDFCETLVFSTRWNRITPMPAEAVAKANSNHRYISVWRGEDGDPYAQWAVFTGREGIPAKVFVGALKRYQSVVSDFWDVAFEGDPEESVKDDGGADANEGGAK